MVRKAIEAFLWRFFRAFHLLSIEGEEHFPKEGPVLVCCNHVNFYDPFIIQLGSPRPVRFVAWVRGFKHIFGWFMLKMGTIPIDLSKPDRRAFEAVLTVLREGGAIGIFPEGRFTPDGHVVEPKVGAARMAIETGAAICPATLTGNFRAWAPQAPGRQGVWGRIFPRPGKITLKFHPPVRLDEKERMERAHDKEYHKQIIEQVMLPVIRRVEPALRAEERIEELIRAPASHIRIYEWLPFIAISALAVFMRLRSVWDLRLLAAALSAYAAYFTYLLADIRWIKQNRRAKFVRNVAAPALLLIFMFPTLFDTVARLRLAVWHDAAMPAAHLWHYPGVIGIWLCDWWTATYLFPLFYIVSSLWAYYFSHYLQFQKCVRGLLLSFYLGLLLIILVPHLGQGFSVQVPEEQWGPLTRWFYTASPCGHWRFLNFPGFFVLMAVFLWLFDKRHRLSLRAACYFPWLVNLILAVLLYRGLPWTHAIAFGLLGWLVLVYLGRVKFQAHDKRWL